MDVTYLDHIDALNAYFEQENIHLKIAKVTGVSDKKVRVVVHPHHAEFRNGFEFKIVISQGLLSDPVAFMNNIEKSPIYKKVNDYASLIQGAALYWSRSKSDVRKAMHYGLSDVKHSHESKTNRILSKLIENPQMNILIKNINRHDDSFNWADRDKSSEAIEIRFKYKPFDDDSYMVNVLIKTLASEISFLNQFVSEWMNNEKVSMYPFKLPHHLTEGLKNKTTLGSDIQLRIDDLSKISKVKSFLDNHVSKKVKRQEPSTELEKQCREPQEVSKHFELMHIGGNWVAIFKLSDDLVQTFELPNLKLNERNFTQFKSRLKGIDFSFNQRTLKTIKQHAGQIVSTNRLKKTAHHSVPYVNRIANVLHEYLNNWELQAQKKGIDQRHKQMFQSMLSDQPYHAFMYQNTTKRKVKCYIAPTNAGKSYSAKMDLMQQVSLNKTSAALFPLRALALENHLWFDERETPSSFITGEERLINPNADVLCQTVETFDINQQYETVLIDEAQLTFDSQRGAAYLKAMVSAQCEELILSASPESKGQITTLFDMLGETVEFVEKERLCPLRPMEAPLQLEDVRKGDLIVAFSMKKIHAIADQLVKEGHRVGTIYGAMSPLARKNMMVQYHKGEIDVMVSTDAIGMGCNCPVDRVLFSEIRKFDGYEQRVLHPEEAKQIAGRAGRFGLATEGQYGTVCLNKEQIKEAEAHHRQLLGLVETQLEPKSISSLYALPDKEVFLASDLTLNETLNAWLTTVADNDSQYEQNERVISELHEKAFYLDAKIKDSQLGKRLAVNLLFMTFSYDKYKDFYRSLIDAVIENRMVNVTVSYLDSIEDLQDAAVKLSMLGQLVGFSPANTVSEEEIMDKQLEVGDRIYDLLIQRYTPKQVTVAEPGVMKTSKHTGEGGMYFN